MCSMAAPASRQALAVVASVAGVMGTAGWSAGCLYAPLGATVTISGSAHWLGVVGDAGDAVMNDLRYRGQRR